MVVVVIGAGVVSGTGAGVGTVSNETTVIFTIQQRRVLILHRSQVNISQKLHLPSGASVTG